MTDNLRLRIKQHNNGQTPFTRKGVPWQLIYYEAFINKKDAVGEERFLKTGRGRERLKFLLSGTMSVL